MFGLNRKKTKEISDELDQELSKLSDTYKQKLEQDRKALAQKRLLEKAAKEKAARKNNTRRKPRC